MFITKKLIHCSLGRCSSVPIRVLSLCEDFSSPSLRRQRRVRPVKCAQLIKRSAVRESLLYERHRRFFSKFPSLYPQNGST